MSLNRLTAARLGDLSASFVRGGVAWRRDGRVMHVVLNRPERLNVVDHDAVTLLQATLENAADDPGIATVVLHGAGEEGLSAGTDLVPLRDAAATGSTSPDFWHDLHHVVELLADYPKSVVTVTDGVTHGSALAIAARGTLRVVTERSDLALPQTGLGLVPDAGGLHLASTLPGQVGTWLALCGETIEAVDALDLGLADHLVLADDLPAMYERLAVDPPGAVVASAAVPARTLGASRSLASARWIRECFVGDDAQTILTRLREHADPAARACADVLGTRSPTAVTATLRALRATSGLSLPDALALERRVLDDVLLTHDFAESARPDPLWSPLTYDLVD